jgi:uncharacterized protein YdhG (YjbR/CyaY superfamily)
LKEINTVANEPKSIDDYLATLSNDKRLALERLRHVIRAAAPMVEECISYHVPGFRLGGRLLVSFGAAKNHCAFYPGAHPIRVHKKELKGYDIGKGTIRFPVEKPLPVKLVRMLVKSRIAEYAA